MINILSWNIQNGRGVDDLISLERIASVIGEFDTPDVICLQEVSRGLTLDEGAEAEDQIETLHKLFPGYEVIFGIAIDARTGERQARWQYGNAILTRLPILSVVLHPLPQPAAGGIRHMARQAIEVSVETEFGPIRIMTTHLEYHSRIQRDAQVAKLNETHAEIAANRIEEPAVDGDGPYQKIVRPAACVLCGDFNIEPDTPEYTEMCTTLRQSSAPLQDAWRAIEARKDHPPSCGIYDLVHWPQGAHCRDYFFVTKKLAQSITQLKVNTDTNASDHQPLLLSLSIK